MGLPPNVRTADNGSRAKPQAHGLYTAKGDRIKEWQGKIVMDMNTGLPQLDPPIRLSRGERVFAWFNGQLVAIFTETGMDFPL